MSNVTLSKRIKAYVIDLLFIFAFMVVLSFLLGAILSIIGKILNTNLFQLDIISNLFMFSILVISIYIYPIFKDLIFSCGSIGYKLTKTKIIDQKTGLRPTKKQLVLRGLFFAIFPIDLVFTYKRLDNLSLADIATNTRVVAQSENGRITTDSKISLENNVTLSKRTKAYFIDLFFIFIIFIVFLNLIIGIVSEFWKITANEPAQQIINTCFLVGIITFIIIFPIFKDLIFPCGGLGFRIMKIAVVDQKTTLPPTKKQLILRGLFFYLYIIDVIFARVRKDNLSLSDIVSGTKLAYRLDYEIKNDEK